MFERIHQKLGTAGFVISIIALVAALGGGAYAATSNNSGQATASAKQGKQGKPGKPGKTGPAGPAGPAGAQGPAGAKGDIGVAGANGTNGTNGAPGQSVTGSPIAASGACGKKTGVKYTLGATSTNVCSGEDGQTGFTETLPAGKTETGTFGLESAAPSVSGTEINFTTISFAIPLAKPLGEPEVHLIAPSGEEVVGSNSVNHEEIPPTKCGSGIETPGGPEVNAANPKAAPGNLCVYIGGEPENIANKMLSQTILDPTYECTMYNCFDLGEGVGSSIAGARIYAFNSSGTNEPLAVWGTWAVTAPTS